MKVLIASLFVFAVVLSQAEHPMLGGHDHSKPDGQAKAHPSETNAVEVHPHPTMMPGGDHPILGLNDGYENLQVSE